ncbi:MAG: DNA repair protein RecN [Candidatus Lambdaproteobacteria bacterium]|nr:DNA repair protein RecN [Candidatus Lambdaproteobacteria bacterium]
MLTRLAIANLATIASIAIEFEAGFTVLTGETGAGKSIMIDAIRLVLGGKAVPDMIRTGAEQLTVEAAFDVSAQPAVIAAVQAQEIPLAGELILRRVVNASGRSRVLLNGSQITMAQLEQIAPYLVNIHGQHDNQMLLNPATHLDFLDGFADLAGPRDRFAQTFRQYSAARREREELQSAAERQQRRAQELSNQIEDIQAASPSREEEAALQLELNQLTHAEQLLTLAGTFGQGLYEAEDALVGRLGDLTHTLAQAAAIDPTLQPQVAQLEPIRIQLEELHQAVRRYAAGLETDPLRLDAVHARLAVLERLKRRFGGSIAAVLETLQRSSQELEALEQSDARLAALERTLGELAKALHQHAQTLTARRTRHAARLSERIMAELKQLGMQNVTFDLRLQPVGSGGGAPQYGVRGAESAEFLLSTNPGQTPRPLSRIASGGELSRTMLALKTILAQADPTSALIFDEVDAGISGATAEIVGRKLRALGRTHQVLCVTHLPQIAAQSDHHFRVSKAVRQRETFTTVAVLDGDERVREVARLLSGLEVSDKSLASAAELVGRAQESPA